MYGQMSSMQLGKGKSLIHQFTCDEFGTLSHSNIGFVCHNKIHIAKPLTNYNQYYSGNSLKCRQKTCKNGSSLTQSQQAA